MSKDSTQISDEDGQIVRFQGRPKRPQIEGEETRWQRFLRVIRPWASEGGEWATYGTDLERQYLEAEISKKLGEGKKLHAEAAEAAARADEQRNQSLKNFNDIIDSIFNDDGLPEMAKTLKFAKLIESNPELIAQISKIEDVIANLRMKYGSSVAFCQPTESVSSVPKESAQGQAHVK